MAGYLGKISAVVAVNTADFEPKLNRAAKDVDRFAASLQRSLASAAQGSARQFSGIYTDVQKLERALYAASRTKLDFSGIKGFEGKTAEEAANQMRRMHEVASQLSAPLAAARKSVESLSIEIQGALHSSLVSAQTAVEGVQTDVELLGSVSKQKFDEATQAVDRYNAALGRSKEASALVGGMATGREFRFSQPRAFEVIRGASESQKALEAEFGQSERVRRLTSATSFLSRGAIESASKVDDAMAVGDSAAARIAQQSLEKQVEAIRRLSSVMSDLSANREDLRRRTLAGVEAEEAARKAYEKSVAAYRASELSEAGPLVDPERDADQERRRSYGTSILRSMTIQDDPSSLFKVGDSTFADKTGRTIEDRLKDIQSQKELAAAKKKQKETDEALAKSSAQYSQVITGQAQSLDQLKGRYDSLLASVKKLDAAGRAAFDASQSAGLAGVRGTLASGDEAGLQAGNAAIDAAEKMVADQVDLSDKAEEARKAIERQQAAIRGVADSIGKSADPAERLKQAVVEMNANIAKLEGKPVFAVAEQKASRLRAEIERVASDAASQDREITPDEYNRLTKFVETLSGSAAAAGAKPPKQKTVDDLFGPAMLSAERSAESLKGKVRGLQTEFDKMSSKNQRAYAGPLNKLRDDIAALPANASSAQVKALVDDFERLDSAIKKINSNESFGKSFSSFINETAPKQYAAQFDAIRAKMVELGASSSGDVSAAVERLGSKLQEAGNKGRFGFKDTRKELRDLMLEVGRAAVAEKLMTKAQSKSFLGGVMRSGDIGRFGADKIGLALNQSAYVIDDFMSASGGLDMKIRAIGNNLTQMGFIIGGTAGLFAALGSVIVTNVGIAVYKWVTGGKTATHTADALNDSLAAQKSTVESLAQAYESLSNAISSSTSSMAGVQDGEALAGAFAASVRARRTQMESLYPTVLGEKIEQNRLGEQLKNASTAGEMLAIRSSIQKSREAEERFSRFRDEGVPQGDIATLRAERNKAVTQLMENANTPSGAIMRMLPKGVAKSVSEELGYVDPNPLIDAVERLSRGVLAAEARIGRQADSEALEAAKGAFAGRDRIESATRLLADAIAGGAPGAVELQQSINRQAIELKAATDQLASATKIEDEVKRAAAIQSASQRVAAAAAGAPPLNGKKMQDLILGGLLSDGSSAGDVLGRLSKTSLNESLREELAGSAADVVLSQERLKVAETSLARATEFAEGIRRSNAESENAFTEERRKAAEAEQAAADAAVKAAQGALDAATKEKQAADAASRRIAAEAEYTLALRESIRGERERSRRGRFAAMDRKSREAADFAAGEGGDVAAAAGDITDPAARAKFIQDYFSGKMRENFASIFASQAADRELAITRGGQARALEASDITTDSGSRELNRLLRGQDSSKDVDNQEMRQQTDLLKVIADGIKQATGQVVEFNF